MNKLTLSILCFIIIFSCKKEDSTDPSKYQLKSYTFSPLQSNQPKFRDSVVFEYNKSILIRATSNYKYGLNTIGLTNTINFVYNQNKLLSAEIMRFNNPFSAILEYDNDNLIKKVETPNNKFSVKYNVSKKISGLIFSYNTIYDFETKNENMVSINRTGYIQKNEYDSSVNPFYFLSDDIKLIIMAEFGMTTFLGSFNGFSKNCLKSYIEDIDKYNLEYEYNIANLPTEVTVFRNSVKFITFKFYYQ